MPGEEQRRKKGLESGNPSGPNKRPRRTKAFQRRSSITLVFMPKKRGGGGGGKGNGDDDFKGNGARP